MPRCWPRWPPGMHGGRTCALNPRHAASLLLARPPAQRSANSSKRHISPFPFVWQACYDGRCQDSRLVAGAGHPGQQPSASCGELQKEVHWHVQSQMLHQERHALHLLRHCSRPKHHGQQCMHDQVGPATCQPALVVSVSDSRLTCAAAQAGKHQLASLAGEQTPFTHHTRGGSPAHSSPEKHATHQCLPVGATLLLPSSSHSK